MGNSTSSGSSSGESITEGDRLRNLAKEARPQLRERTIGEFLTILSKKSEKAALGGYQKCIIDDLDTTGNFKIADFVDFQDEIARECRLRGLHCQTKYGARGVCFEVKWEF